MDTMAEDDGPVPRARHAAELLGDTLVVYGGEGMGEDSGTALLGDVWGLNLTSVFGDSDEVKPSTVSVAPSASYILYTINSMEVPPLPRIRLLVDAPSTCRWPRLRPRGVRRGEEPPSESPDPVVLVSQTAQAVGTRDHFADSTAAECRLACVLVLTLLIIFFFFSRAKIRILSFGLDVFFLIHVESVDSCIGWHKTVFGDNAESSRSDGKSGWRR